MQVNSTEYAIHCRAVEGCDKRQDEILHLVFKIDDVIQSGLKFVFTNGHAIMQLSDFYSDINELEHVVDFEIMRSKYWNDTAEDPDRKRRRQAEFLIYRKAPINIMYEIAVFDEQNLLKIEELIQKHDIKIP